MVTRREFLKTTAVTAGATAMTGLALSRAGAQEQQPLSFKGGGTAAGTDPSTVAGEKFAKLVGERTGGKITIGYFGSGQLGGEREMVEGVQLGSLGMVVTGVTGHRIYDAFFLPYVFRDRDHMWKVLGGPIGEEWNQTMIKERNLRVLGYGYRGPRQLTTTKVKVTKPADVKGLKVRVPEIAPMVATWKTLGAAPTPMAWPEVFTALQTGTIEGQENPLEIINSSKLWEVQKYLHLTNHVRVAWITLLDDRLWKKMTPTTQKVMTDTWREVADEMQRTVLAREREYLDAARKGGMTIVQEPELDLRAFRDAVKDVWRDIAPKAWGQGVYERIQATT
jgi:tripartite ATP-independent transporter DctP family solute receptor